MGGVTIFAVATVRGIQQRPCRAISGFGYKCPISTINSLHVRHRMSTTSTLQERQVRLANYFKLFFSQLHCPSDPVVTSQPVVL